MTLSFHINPQLNSFMKNKDQTACLYCRDSEISGFDPVGKRKNIFQTSLSPRTVRLTGETNVSKHLHPEEEEGMLPKPTGSSVV